ncbi:MULTISPECIES: hypothetical protein [unclassified Agrococcus]|uniref:hypothetical protein n=1 Tax=unclassified Agrococcus TaxID=2615065 RepID=UPI00361CFBC2
MTTPEQHDRHEVAPGAVGGPPPQSYPRPETGAIAWWIGFLYLIPVPIVSQLASWIAPVVTHVRMRRLGGLPAEVSRHAANWQLTVAAITIGGLLLLVLPGGLVSATTGDREGIVALVAVGVWFALISVAGIATVVHMVLGGMKAGRGEVHRPWGAIAFFKPVA